MSMKTTEHDLQHDHLTHFLISPLAEGGLGWQEGKANQVDPHTLIHKSDLLHFLEHGNELNRQSWKALWRDCGHDEQSMWDAIKKAFLEASEKSLNHVFLLREGFKVLGHAFHLWNEPAQRNSTASNQTIFQNNCFRVTNEVVFKTENLQRRPDWMFHINGVYYAYAEIKAKQQRQSAAVEGIHKIIMDYRLITEKALYASQDEWEQKYGAQGPAWPGYTRHFETAKQSIRSKNPLFEKAAWVAALDGGAVWLMSSFDTWMTQVEEVLLKNPKRPPSADDDLKNRMREEFTKLPDIADMKASEQVRCHLAGLLDHERGIALEIELFHHLRGDKSTQQYDVIKPRNPQRVFMERVIYRTQELYARERTPDWLEKDLREKIHRSLPGLETSKVEEIIQDRMHYKNGREAYSILCQGAAGLGKTNLAVWMGIYLYKMLEPLRPGQSPNQPRQPLFDRIIILTDRTELRDNVAQEAERSLGTREQILNADEGDLLRKVLKGEPLPSHVKAGGGIIVSNLQKFPSLVDNLAKEGFSLPSRSGRTAFIIDEVHRSQSGSLNEQAVNLFVNKLTDIASEQSAADKKNLIIGLTATPSDTILARFGEWHAPVSMSDSNRWKPYFSYALQQAIDDGFILDPTSHYYRYNVNLAWKSTETHLKAPSASNVSYQASSFDIYEDPRRQALVAEKFAEIFATVTMRSIRDQSIRTLGPGKAMITVPSIKAAIGMHQAVREALLKLADDADGKPWDRYKEIVKDVANHRLFVLYTNSETQGKASHPSCESLNHGMSEKEVIKAFRCVEAGKQHNKRNAIIIVVDKLLTGFDEPTLHTLHIDRNLEGIGLFQAMCRVNRKTKNKADTLIIDTCHDESVAKEFPKVFRKYGGIALSDLDGVQLLERLNALHKHIIGHVSLKPVWTVWKKASKHEEGESKKQASTLLSDTVEDLKRQPLEAVSLRKTCGSYLHAYKLSKAILELDKAHSNADGWLDFVFEVHKMLRSDGDPGKVVNIDFDVINIERDDLDSLAPHHTDAHRDKRESSDDDGTLVDRMMKEDMRGVDHDHDSYADKVMELQEIEARKRQRSQDIAHFLDQLYQKLDEAGKSLNSDQFRKTVLSKQYSEHDPDKLFTMFCQLMDRAADVSFKRRENYKRYLNLVRNWREMLMFEYTERLRRTP